MGVVDLAVLRFIGEHFIECAVGLAAAIILAKILYRMVGFMQRRRIRKKVRRLAGNAIEMSPEEFFDMRNQTFGGQGSPLYANHFNYPGVYILYNVSRDMVYVGQGQQVLNRVNNHFTGKGNGDVYADYVYGDEFTIRSIAIRRSGFKTLNELERHTIEVYDAQEKGYNKTRGNR